MTVSMESDWGYVWSEFQGFLSDLGSEEQDAYWRHAGKYAYGMGHQSQQYKQLCLALHEIESGKRSKRTNVLVPTKAKARAADELQRAVVRHKAKLLCTEPAQEFLVYAACNWIQFSFTAALNDMLDVVGCLRDGKGTRKGPIPHFSPDDTKKEALRLAVVHGTRPIMLVCAGLMLSDFGWSNLRLARESLKQASVVEPMISPPLNAKIDSPPEVLTERGAELTQVGPPSHTEVLCTTIEEASLSTLASNLDNLGNFLTTAAAEASAGDVQDPAPLEVLPERDTEPMRVPPPNHTEVLCSTIDEATLSTLASNLENLGNFLTTAAAEASSGEVPDLAPIIDLWQQLRGQYSAAAAQLNVETSRLADLSKALAIRSRLASQLIHLASCRAIRHLSEPNFEPIRAKCEALEEEIRQGQHSSVAELAVQSLLRLVEEGQLLNDSLVGELQCEVEVVFGRTVAMAAVRGKLVLESADREKYTPADYTTPLALEIAESTFKAEAPVCEPMPPAGQTPGKIQVHGNFSLDASPAVDATAQPTNVPLTAEMTTAHAPATPAEEAPPSINVADLRGRSALIVEQTSDAAVAVDFESFDHFCRTHWVDASGQVVLAPWSAPGFAKIICDRVLQAWQLGDAGMAYLLARATEAVGSTAPLQLDDLTQADELLSAPDSPTAGRQPERVERLRRYVAAEAGVGNPDIGIGLMLEALRPTLPCTLTPPEIERLLARASYNDSSIDEIVRFLLSGWASQLDPLESLRRRLLDVRAEPFEKLEDALRKAQEALKHEVTALWSAAGGKIQRTHCRAAWTQFVQQHVAPLRDELAPIGPRAGVVAPRLTASSIGSRVVGIGRAFVRIMDNAGVRHQDRSAADSAAQQIVAAISHVADALLAVETRRRQDQLKASYDGVPFDAGMRLLADACSSTTDRLCASLFAAVLGRQPRATALRLKACSLLNHVDVIRFLHPGALLHAGIAQDGLRVLYVEDPRAACVLLGDASPNEGEAPDSDEEFLVALRDAAAEGTRRNVLAALSQTSVLLDHQRTLLHQFAFDLSAETFLATQRLETIWSACDELMAPNETRLKIIVDEAREMTQPEQDASASVNKRLLRLNWLERNVELAARQRDDAAHTLVAQARASSPELAERIELYFQADDYRAGFALLHGGAVPQGEPNRLEGRSTIWRDDALAMWTEPRTKLGQDLRGATEEQQRLADIWSSGATENEMRDALPKLLYTVISGETDREKSKRRSVRLSDLREHQTRRTIVNCEAIRSYFQKSGMNPTFLPQLADYRQIVIMLLPQSGVRGGSVSSDWAAAATSDEATRALYAFLAPGLARPRRDDLCSDLRKRGVTAAIIDDIDLCRLCAAFTGSHTQSFVPFLEILLEQIDLVDASPFSSLDGQHVRLETYVGRDQEARKIALSAEYTRLFSGRKLGKSALLKYVADRFDGRKLDSDNTLNVFFITIAGGDSEPWVVDAILAAMIERFGLQERPEARGLDAASRFMDYMNHFLSERPTHSVLFILDEADAFVEKQLTRYNTAHDSSGREGSLSFRMMKQLPIQDAKGLPRVRTLFSGYRTTNTRGGVWANAGDVLLLPPLEIDEAVKFLQGMLARIGISLGDHAPFVAMRCGFQPAVLIRFGESLVKRLRRATRSAHREMLVVSREEVSATLVDQAVLDEIKTVVNNNFQGNRMGAIVFGATLLALKDLEPGFALTDGAAQVLVRLSKIDPDLDWLERIDASPLAEIERHLQDFIERGLLTQAESHRRLGDREYRLRFPHFLTVLTRHSDVAQEVRQQIQAIRAGGTQRRLVECVLSESAMSTVRYWYRERDTATCKLVVVGGHWKRALLDAKCGVPDRLGCDRYGVADLANSEQGVASWPSDVRVLFNGSARHWPNLLGASASRPLVVIGDLGLQRSAIEYALEGGEIPVEVITLGRTTQATLAWWFEDARALHFSASDAIARIAQATDLVPYLVDALDQRLPQAPGTDVSPADLQAALEQLEASLPELASKLCDASEPGHLLPREAQLLVMAGRVADEVTDEFDLKLEFQDCWMMLDLPTVCVAPPLSDAGDWQALKLLAETGLLPTRIEPDESFSGQSLGRVRFNRNGPLARLIKALDSSHAA